MTIGRSSGDENKDKNDNNPMSPAGGFHSIRDRFRFKRNSQRSTEKLPSCSSPDRQWKTAARSHHHHHHSRSYSRKLIFFCLRGKWLYLCIFLVLFVFALASMVLQSSIMSVFRQNERARWRWSVRDDLKIGSSLEFVQPRRFQLGNGLDLVRNHPRIGVRPPRIALVRILYTCVHV